MKMNYILKNNDHKKRILSKPIKVIFSVFIIVLIIHFSLPNSLSSFFTIIVSPFWNIEKNVKYGDSFISIQNLIKENDSLKKKIEENENRYTFIESIRKENEDLKYIMGRDRSNNSILARIIKKPPFSSYDVFVLDIGNKNNIKVGDRIYALGDILIGEIIETNPITSKAKLYSSYGEKFNIFVGDNHIETVARGIGGGIFEAELPRDTKITIGDSVSIPDLTNSFSGKVYEINREASEPFSKIYIKQTINLYELSWVLIKPMNNTKI